MTPEDDDYDFNWRRVTFIVIVTFVIAFWVGVGLLSWTLAGG